MATDYKNTLNLPRTDFAMRADLVKREPQRLAKWEADDLYGKIQAARAGAEKFILHDGPPFANGDVHIGTALNKILKDIILKYQTIRGKATPYVPGWDCHGLPIEFKVTQEMRKKGNTEADAATIRTACDAYARKFIDLQRVQFKRLGVLGEWDKPYLTLDKKYEAEELRLFADIVDKGFVYRGKKPVYWSIPARTALAEAEVEYKDHVSNSIFVKFPIVGQPGVSIVIWTTTPWTLPANLAVAYNSRFNYTMVRVENEVFIVSTMLLDKVAATAGWSHFEIVRTVGADELAQFEYQHPFCDRTGKLFPGDSFVTNDTGSGFVHIAPGHGQEDYQIGLANGLPVYSPVDDEGRLAHTDDLPVEQQMGPELVGKSVLEKNGKSDANEAVLDVLREKNALIHREDYTHSYPHCWRSKTPVIFRAMDQWFVRIDHHAEQKSNPSPDASDNGQVAGPTFRQQAIETIDKVNWIPGWGIKRIRSAVESRPDWCISRQRTWGVPIPAFYDADNNPILDPRVIRKVANVVGEHGSNIWFEKSAEELWEKVRPEDWTGPEAHSKSTDTLDVWIDSGSSSRAVTAKRKELHRSDQPFAPAFQADMYLEGSDQHRGWFQSSLLLSLAGNGAAPYKTVLTHGFMVDADKEKISKSKQGAYEKPQTAEAYVKNYGADVVRLWVASQDFRNDIIVSDERIKTVSETYRGFRNSLRYQLSNLYDFDPAKHAVPDGELTSLDRWILWKFSEVEREVVAAYDKFEFHIVYQKLSQFVAVELSAMYHDLVKDRLYTDPANSSRRRSTQTTLHRLVTQLCQLLSPILVFTTDEAWEFIPSIPVHSPHLSQWVRTSFTPGPEEILLWNELFATRETVLGHLEEARKNKVIGKSLEAKVRFSGYTKQAISSLEKHLTEIKELLNVSQVEVDSSGADNPDAAHAFIVDVVKADGEKCARCWHSETDIGKNTDHPTICGRCVEAVSATAAG